MVWFPDTTEDERLAELAAELAGELPRLEIEELKRLAAKYGLIVKVKPDARAAEVARLELARKTQEEAWYRAGLSREQIIAEFEGWPTNIGYPAYEWTVGDPPVDA